LPQLQGQLDSPWVHACTHPPSSHCPWHQALNLSLSSASYSPSPLLSLWAGSTGEKNFLHPVSPQSLRLGSLPHSIRHPPKGDAAPVSPPCLTSGHDNWEIQQWQQQQWQQQHQGRGLHSRAPSPSPDPLSLFRQRHCRSRATSSAPIYPFFLLGLLQASV
jgi:hypothetical protein